MIGMILAAGLGTRMKPFTDTKPKALASVNGKTVLQRNIEWLQQYGINEVVVNVHHFADQIIDAIGQHKGWGSQVHISDESDAVLETGGGLMKAAHLLKGHANVVAVNADILTDLPLDEMMAYHIANQPLATLATTGRNTSRYLMFKQTIETGINLRLCGWKNILTHEVKGSHGIPKAFSGVQIISSEFFSAVSLSGKFSVIDAYLTLCGKFPIFSFDHSQSKLVDIGTMEKLKKAGLLFD